MKLALLRNAFMQLAGVFDVTFEFAIPLAQFRRHEINSGRRIDPRRWAISDSLAEDELMGHVVRGAS
jgi:hypothetical protein